ncbi:MAG: oligosaccharide flippase family protein, partial [Lachnospiraceae bacterium]|nr:oligosaccharide flippase family protein [Lachnospiraceae bacterium]
MQDMTTGPIAWAIIQFAIPMVLGNLLQLTYNAVDSVIIGKNLGETALAAVATSNPIMTIMILG